MPVRCLCPPRCVRVRRRSEPSLFRAFARSCWGQRGRIASRLQTVRRWPSWPSMVRAIHQRAFGLVVVSKDHLGELLGPAKTRAFGQHAMGLADLGVQVAAQGRVPRRPQPRGPVADRGTGHGGHARRGRALARRIGEDMQEGQAAILNQLQRIVEHLLGFGRKAGDDVGAEDHVGTQPPRLLAEGDGIVAQMAALHPLQDHVVTRLQRQVQMRHQARFRRDGQHQVVVGFDRIDAADAQARQVRHQPQDAHDQIAKPRRARQIGAPTGQVHPGQHDFVEAGWPTRRLPDHLAGRTRIAAPGKGMMQKVQR